MGQSLNRIVLVGRLCSDPEMKYTPSGVAVANFRIAVDRKFDKEETDFIDIVAWRQTAEFANQFLTKGRLVAIDGRLQIRQWQTKEGDKRKTAEVVADDVQALDSGNRGENQGQQRSHPVASQSAPATPDIMDPFADQ